MLSSSFRIPTVSGIRPILASPTSIRCTLNRGCRLKFGGKDSLSSLFILCNFSGGSLQSSISTFSGKYFFSPSVNIFFQKRVYIYINSIAQTEGAYRNNSSISLFPSRGVCWVRDSRPWERHVSPCRWEWADVSIRAKEVVHGSPTPRRNAFIATSPPIQGDISAEYQVARLNAN